MTRRESLRSLGDIWSNPELLLLFKLDNTVKTSSSDIHFLSAGFK